MRNVWLPLLMLSFLGTAAPGGLRHRYSFSGTAEDSIGAAHGALVNNGSDAYYSGTSLELANSELPNSNSTALNYVDLPNGMISSLGLSMTIEAWITWYGPDNSSWQRIFDFGTSDAGENQAIGGANSTYFFLTPRSSGGTFRFGYRAGAELETPTEYTLDSSPLPVDQEVHVAIVWDDVSGQVRMFLNGQQVAAGPLHYTLADMPDVNNWLGRSQWPDTAFNGSYNEFRIYDIALSEAMLSASYQAGPDAPITVYAAPQNPTPQNGGDAGLMPVLTWQSDASTDIIGHRVYLGSDVRSVLTATPASTGIYQTMTSVGNESFTPSETLAMNQTFYWRIEEVTDSGYIFSGPLWSFHTVNLTAHDPQPYSGAEGVGAMDVTLQWQSGVGAVGHRIWLGENPGSLQVLQPDHPDTFYHIGDLDFGTLYYWRIDELYPSSTAVEGEVWSFRTMNKPAACLPGDLDGNCTVNVADLVLFSQSWMDSIDCSAFDCADFDESLFVDLADLAILARNWQQSRNPLIVINEIHYHPDENTEPVEFIELYNAGAQPIDLDGWYLDSGVSYTFEETALINPGEFVIICQNPAAFETKFGMTAYGPFDGKLSNEGEQLVLRDAWGNKIDEVTYQSEFPWPVAAHGEGASMELINPYLDNDLAGSWRSSGYQNSDRPELAFAAPSPGLPNQVYAEVSPPQIRQVNHTPSQPLSSDAVTVTAKITDLDGVQAVSLHYQLVAPGAYLPAYLPIPIASLVANPYQPQPLNPAFEDAANWLLMPMVDDGSEPDQVAGDHIYTAVIPAQVNRTLVRYRISATDSANQSIRVPYADDASLNFACFVYDGVPAYVTTDNSVHPEGTGHAYTEEILTSLPVYTLITRTEDLYQCNGYNSADQINQGSTSPAVQDAGRAYNWAGTFVYDGRVYDHIGYRLRGGNGRYNNGAAGKRSMKFRFNRGNYFQARDIYGNKFPSAWQHLNTGKMFGNKIVWENYRKYPYGLNEVMDMLLFDIADVPSPHTYWMHFRVIDGPTETPTDSGGQYNGDFWGLHVAFENYDGAFLERLGLPKGNLYKLSDKIYDGARQLRYQGENAVTDSTDYENIRWNLNHEASADFIRNHLDCNEWYRYHTVTEAIRHYDIFSDATCSNCLKNVAWYFYPEYTAGNNYLGKLQFLPFDVDDTWGPFFNYGCDHGKAAIYDQMYNDSHILQQFAIDPEKSPLRQEYRNYIREFRDLIWQPEVIDPLILEMASNIADFVPADRDRWRLDPTPGGAIDNGPLEDGIALMQQFAWNPGSFDGRYYWVGTSNNLDNLANAEEDAENLPHTPTVSYIGAAGYPENDLRFETSAFSDPQGNETFAAMQWRIAEVEPGTGGGPDTVTLIDSQETDWKYYRAISDGPSEPADAWTDPQFNDNSWQVGQTSIGYGDNDDNTDLSEQSPPMQGNYKTIYLRKDFEIANLADIASFALDVYVDDGCIIWINGTEVARHHCTSEFKDWNDTSGAVVGDPVWESVSLPVPYDYFVEGDNTIAVHVLNQDLTSSDLSIDLELTMTYGAEPTAPRPLAPRLYEYDAVWESGELETFNNTVLFPANGIKPGKTYRVRCKMKDNTGRWSHWSAPIEFIAGEALRSDLRDHLRITELMYNNGDAEFIELMNTGTTTLDLSNVSFTSGVQFAFAGSSIESLAPGAYVLIVKSQVDFEAQYDTGLNSLIAGQFASGSLSNSGETLKLEDTWDGTLIEFTYSDARGWPLAADGAGHALVPQSWAIEDQPLGILDHGANWRAGTYIGGSPGTDDPVTDVVVVINELMAHTDFSDPVNYPGYDSNDWIELFNAGDSSVSLNGNWYLSDDSDELKKWALPGSSLPSGGYVSYDETTGFHQPLPTGFGLDKAGEQLFLSYLPGTGQDRVVDCTQFKGQENSVSLGRLPDGGPYWFALAPATRNAANSNAVPHLVISELMYHPLDGQEEYVELFNPTASAVALAINLPQAGIRGWVLNGGVDYEFPAGTPALTGNSRILLVGFDPSDTALLEAFETAYDTGNLTPGVDIFGPWVGSLSNGGERLSLEKPQDSDDLLNPLAVSWIIVDECIYDDDWPWPTAPDGTGSVLKRQSTAATASGNDPANWQAANPTPGS